MEIEIVLAAIMITVGVVRLILMKNSRMPLAFGAQRYFPWLFIVVGAIFLVLAIID